MKSKIIWLIISCTLILSLILTSCGNKTSPTISITQPTIITTTTSTTTTTTKPATTPANVTGNWWDKFGEPQYGGTITVRKTKDPSFFDPYQGVDDIRVESFYLETLAMGNWKIDRSTWDLKTRFYPPEYCSGYLAESWETPDMSTYIFHIRQGVRWQDKPPVNGRELTASDIQYTWNRMLGLGDGFTKQSPTYPLPEYSLISSVKATDKYTVVFKLSSPSLGTFIKVLNNATCGNIVPREAVEQSGGLIYWRNAVGTGPFILDDYVSGSSLSYNRNQNYWGYSDWYPKNRLPFVDNVKMLIIPDDATTLAAFRTSKIDLLESLAGEKAADLMKSNPQFIQVTGPANGIGLAYAMKYSPFTDIKVRQALQMALDLNTIAKAYYGGAVDGIPYGIMGPAARGYFTPLDQWTKEVKEGYKYNPSGAKKLLTEAGYPNGFKTSVVVAANSDLDLLQIIKAYFSEIGVTLAIDVMDTASFTAFTRTGKVQTMAVSRSAAAGDPTANINQFRTNYITNYGGVSDPGFDKILDDAFASLDMSTMRDLIKKADYYAIERHWMVSILPLVIYNVYQPWFKGYSGETYMGGSHYARFWIDHNLKKALGH